jgi:flagellar hook-associated protein 1 FlgK
MGTADYFGFAPQDGRLTAMGNLFGSLLASSGAMRAFERGLSTTQNNVVNANTPGYAKQRQIFEADRFEPERNIMGGVKALGLYNYRDAFSERNVQRRSSQAALEQQRSNSLTSLEALYPITEGAGVPGALNKFFGAFSQLTVSPNDSASRQVALDRADDLAFNFRRSANLLLEERGNSQVTLNSSVERINEIAGRIRDLNANRRGDSQASGDPGSEAKLFAALEELSELVDFTTIQSSDGGVSVYLGGQSLLVIGDRQYPISTDVLNNQARILDSDGNEITAELTGGKLTGLVDVYNNKIPAYLDDLNTLAGQFADTLNAALAQGVDQNGNPPLQDLFSYDASLGSAFTINVNGIAPEQLALSAPGEAGGNANAIAITELAKAPTINNQSFHQFYGVAAGRVGRDLSGAKAAAGIQTDLLSQAKELRAELQDVSLDEEAAQLIQFQRAYQATSQLFKTINEMTDTIINVMLR